jgi:hypothetical protein
MEGKQNRFFFADKSALKKKTKMFRCKAETLVKHKEEHTFLYV